MNKKTIPVRQFKIIKENSFVIFEQHINEWFANTNIVIDPQSEQYFIENDQYTYICNFYNKSDYMLFQQQMMQQEANTKQLENDKQSKIEFKPQPAQLN